MKKISKLFSLILVAGLSVSMMGCGGNREAKVINSIDDLAGAKIGAQQGTTGHLYVEDKYKDNNDGTKVEPYNKYADAVAALKKGIIDCVVIDQEPADVFVAQNPDLKILEEPIQEETYAICVSKNNSELKDQVNKCIEELESNGTLKSIIDNYEGPDKGKSPYVPDANNTGANGKLVVATNATFPPYEYYDGDKIVGIDIDIAQAIADSLNMTLDVQDMEFDSIIASVQSGKADLGIAGISINEERKKSVDFSEPYINSKQVLIVKKNEGK